MKIIRRLISRIIRRIKRSRFRARLLIGLHPVSDKWGFDRGTPIHRYYLESYLAEHASDIRNHCLEFHDCSYITKFGGERVSGIDILSVDDTNPLATIVADLTRANSIPSETFDCIICTHVLQLVGDQQRFVSELYRILKPNGVLIVGEPGISMTSEEWRELWRYTELGLKLLCESVFGAGKVETRAYGNSLAAAGEIRGMAAEDFRRSELDYRDTRFAVEVMARAVRR